MSTPYRISQRALWAEGQPISDLMSRALANPGLFSLAAGFVDQQSLPVEATQAAVAELLSDPEAARAALQYGTTPGYPPLREAILTLEQETDGQAWPATSLDQVMITAGSNQLLHLVGDTLLDAGDLVLCASPTYLVFLGTLQNIGARAFGVAVDDEGMIPESLEESLQTLERVGQLDRVKLIYLVSYFDNPRGITMPLARKQAIVEIAKRWSKHHRIHVIEDAAYRLLRYGGDDVPSARTVDEDGNTVILAGTFSKCFSPGIRLGWGILPRHLVKPLEDQKGNIDFGSPNFSQHVMARVLERGLLRQHVSRVREAYRAKLQAMLRAADQTLAGLKKVHWVAPQGGLYVWLTVPDSLDTGPEGPLFDLAVQEGVLYVPGQYCYPRWGQPACRNTLRLSFGVQTPAGIQQGMQALRRALERVL